MREPNGGVIMLPDNFTAIHNKLIVALAARHRVPAIYPFRYIPSEGGLISYGVDVTDLHRRAASYVDRILKGARTSDLPVSPRLEARPAERACQPQTIGPRAAPARRPRPPRPARR